MASSVLFTHLLGANDVPVYMNSQSRIGYPDPDSHADIFGTVYLPRVYGKDLTAFEIASSGKIALTIYDRHVLDIDRDSNTSTTLFKAADASSIQIATSNEGVVMTLNASNNNFEIFSSNQISFSACNGINFGAVSDVAYNSATGDLKFFAQCNVYMTSCNDVYITAWRDIVMSAANGSVLFWMDPPNSNLTFSASNNVTFIATDGFMTFKQGHDTVNIMMASNNMVLSAASNIEMNTGGLNVFSATSSNIQMRTDLSLQGDFAIQSTPSNDVQVQYVFTVNKKNELELLRITNSNNVVVSKKLVSLFAAQRTML